MAFQLRRTLNALSSTAFPLHNLATSTTSTNLRSQPFRSTTTASSFSTFNSNNKKIGPDTAMSGLHEIAFCGTYGTYGRYERKDLGENRLFKWYSIKVPDPECPSSSSSSSSEEEEIDNIAIQKKPLRRFSSVRMVFPYKQHAVIGSHLYSIGGMSPDGVFYEEDDSNIYLFVKPCRLDLNCPKAGWKTLPPMNYPNRWDPPSVTLDGKLYVMDNLRHFNYRIFKMPEEIAAKGHGWMEVYDPILNTWEPLPNPPFGADFETHDSPLLYTALPSRKQILVVQPVTEPYRMICPSATFYIYNVITRSWTTLVPPKRKLHSEYINWTDTRPVVVDNTLYWAMFSNGKILIQAYNIDTEMWFRGTVHTGLIFLNHEYMSDYGRQGSPPLLHLADQKFCLLLHSTFRVKRAPEADFHGYLTCVILDVSPILDEDDDDDEDNDNDYDQLLRLNISILSVKKYPLVRPILVWDNVLLNGKLHTSKEMKLKSTSEASVMTKD